MDNRRSADARAGTHRTAHFHLAKTSHLLGTAQAGPDNNFFTDGLLLVGDAAPMPAPDPAAELQAIRERLVAAGNHALVVAELTPEQLRRIDAKLSVGK